MLDDGQQSCHIFKRVLRFEIGGLDCDDPVIGGVRFIEAITGKIFPIVKNIGGCFLIDIVFDGALNKLFPVGF